MDIVTTAIAGERSIMFEEFKPLLIQEESFQCLEASPSDSKVTGGDNRKCPVEVEGIGCTSFVTVCGEEMVILDVLCVSDLCKTISLMVMHKMSVLFQDGKVEVHSTKTGNLDRKSTRLNSSHSGESRMPSSA